MFAVSEVVPNGPQAGQSQTQQQVIASVVALQRVIAGQSNAESGDSTSRNFSNQKDQIVKTADPADKQVAKETSAEEKPAESSAEVQSVIEAQEAANTDTEITAAFQARHGLSDLLSVIRDPEDRMLPSKPETT